MTAKANPLFEQLEAFVGAWEMKAITNGVAVAGSWVKFEWIEGGAFLFQHTKSDPPLPNTPQIWIDNNPNPIKAIIGFDDHTQLFYYVYSDVRGVRRVYKMSFKDKVWKFWGQAAPQFYQRAENKFSDDGDSITGRIERSTDGKNWELDFNTQYTKIK
jgi:hypothetical protein